MSLDGILPVWKPADWTSHDVVAKARRLLGIKRIGHTGTLDPAVTGVLPLCIGKATRLVEYLQEQPKEYEARLIIGLATDTEDLTGKVTERVDRVELREEEIRTAIRSFIGEIEQVPPMYSAVKVAGKRLYELARQGEVVERKPRRVTIHELEITGFTPVIHPEVAFRVRCSKGTYIRSLCRDIGQALGYPAVMAQLVRTETGGLRREHCLTMEQIADRVRDGTLAEALIPPDVAVEFLPAVRLDARQSRLASLGQRVTIPQGKVLSPGQLTRVYGEDTFIGLFRTRQDGRTLVPEKVFVP